MERAPVDLSWFTPERRAQLRLILRTLLQRDAYQRGHLPLGEPLQMSTIEHALQHLNRGWDLPDLAGLPHAPANALRAFDILLKSPSVPTSFVDDWLQENLRAAVHEDHPRSDSAEGGHSPGDVRRRLAALIDALPPEQRGVVAAQLRDALGSEE